jgi:hypothetical protein
MLVKLPLVNDAASDDNAGHDDVDGWWVQLIANGWEVAYNHGMVGWQTKAAE